MAKLKHEVRDAIHGFVHFDILEKRLIDSRPFQRLRCIHQLAMSYQVYPGAVHNRFEHSMGVMEFAGKIFDSIFDSRVTDDVNNRIAEQLAEKKYWRKVVRIAALLHDIGHLRTPSEMVRLRWTDILWDTDRIVVHSPKTEGYEGKETRVVPFFPELQTLLNEAWETAEENSEFVITRYRSDSQNLRTTLMKIIERAGLKPWPKLFQNMRASRQTELEETFPTHVVCKWMGNSPKVAQKHYLHVTDSHFEKATQNPTQQASANDGTASLSTSDDIEEAPENEKSQRLQVVENNPARTRTWKIRTKI